MKILRIKLQILDKFSHQFLKTSLAWKAGDLCEVEKVDFIQFLKAETTLVIPSFNQTSFSVF